MNTKTFVLTSAWLLATGIGSALAADTNTLTVTANVTGTCKFNSTTSTLAFGALDPSSAGPATANATTAYWCTKGTIAAASADTGANPSGTTRRMKNGTEYIPYSLTLSGEAQTGLGKGTSLTLGLAGSIANADFINAAAGAYEDTVTLTINP